MHITDWFKETRQERVHLVWCICTFRNRQRLAILFRVHTAPYTEVVKSWRKARKLPWRSEQPLSLGSKQVWLGGNTGASGCWQGSTVWSQWCSHRFSLCNYLWDVSLCCVHSSVGLLNCIVIKVKGKLLPFCPYENNGRHGDLYIRERSEEKVKCQGQGKSYREIWQLLKLLKMLIRSLRWTGLTQLCQTHCDNSSSSGTCYRSSRGCDMQTKVVFILVLEVQLLFSTQDQINFTKRSPSLWRFN